MFQHKQSIATRTVGVVERKPGVQPGYTLFSAGREQYLIDEDGRVVHEWRSKRQVFTAKLLSSGNLLRDGSDNADAVGFQAGGAAGFVEEVTWENELVWEFTMMPNYSFLSHHDVQPMPNGNVLLLVWERKTKEQALSAGRREDLVPDGEVWNNKVIEIAPQADGDVKIVWQWSLWDHLIQDVNPAKANFGDVAAHPELIDINFCVPLGKAAMRNRDLLTNANPLGNHATANPSCLKPFADKPGKTGEKDWVHANAVGYDPVRDLIVLSFCTTCEILVVDHSTTSAEASGHTGGKRGRGGDILFRFGNLLVSRQGTRMDQVLFGQHSPEFIRGCPGEGNILLFNNGRMPDRPWTTIEEYSFPEIDEWIVPNGSQKRKRAASHTPVWQYGSPIGRNGSFYCTHLSACQRLPNGNTFITQGPQGILVEVDPDGVEVWRYVSPVCSTDQTVSFVRQGDTRTSGKFAVFKAMKYASDYAAFAKLGSPLVGARYLEA